MTLRKAIVTPYCVDQNQPSLPHRKLLEVPEDPKLREEVLRQEWRKEFTSDDEEPDQVTMAWNHGMKSQ